VASFNRMMVNGAAQVRVLREEVPLTAVPA
jgi:hypothetical protein